MAVKCTHIGAKGPCNAYQEESSGFCHAHRPADLGPPVSFDQPVVGEDMRERAETPARPARGKPKPPDPELVGAAIQQMLIRQENRSRSEAAHRRARTLERDDKGYDLPGNPAQVPYKIVPRRARVDRTVAVDPDTKRPPKSLQPGWVYRWVRTRDHMDRPTAARVGDFEDYGYQVVEKDGGGPFEGPFGVLMQAPPEQYALRAADNTPKGALDRDAALNMAIDVAGDVNRMMGDEVARIVVGDEHRSERVLVGSGVERVED